MRITYRSKNNREYWKERWQNISIDEPINNEKIYPIKFSNMIINNHNQKILEAGCGAGRILRYYHNKNFKIIGIEFIENIVKKLKSIDNSLDVRVGNILNLNFSNNFFDVILSFGLYHNFQQNDLSKSLDETFRVLKNGGILCASFRADNLQEKILDWINRDKFSKKKEFHKLNLKKKEFIELLQKHNFKIKKVYNVQNMPFLYKFKFFREKEQKKFNENIARAEGYKLSFVGKILQNILIKIFPENFCNLYLIIAEK